ncbi:YNL011C [Saccharomyces arboricola H-6]|uniref:YNL011C n=1 Tax=Saccharomyces arboricola (strain H-6 / AS 2.3317 / CBS 10644) TaxID=1160507 RepID=J8PIG2_SACAR|nr:YNL011C [Saccharomyces arboricola H-6]
MNVVVCSGGTATNSLTPCFSNISVLKGHELTYILPISDNGGSTSEILRIVGGPAIGDIRSRIVRLLQDEQLVKLFAYRLPNDKVQAKKEWNEIVEGSHPIWKNISIEIKEICRSFIIHMQAELLKKIKHSNPFQFESASIGNFFLTGARLFLGSLDASIELMMRIGRCSPQVHVVPCINTNHTHHISALLTNGEMITGQSQISHPSKSIPKASGIAHPTKFIHLLGSYDDHLKIVLENEEEEEEAEEEYANPTYILPELKNSQLHFDKLDSSQNLSAPVNRILYINPYGEEIKPMGNPRAISKVKKADMVVYSIGSVMTSLLPILILGNLAEIILESTSTKKVLLVNNKYDREIFGLDGLHYVQMIIDSMTRAIRGYRQSKGIYLKDANFEWQDLITDIVYLKNGEIKIDETAFNKHNIRCHQIASSDKMETEELEIVLNKIGSKN